MAGTKRESMVEPVKERRVDKLKLVGKLESILLDRDLYIVLGMRVIETAQTLKATGVMSTRGYERLRRADRRMNDLLNVEYGVDR